MNNNEINIYFQKSKQKYTELFGKKCIHPNQETLTDLIVKAEHSFKENPQFKLGTHLSWIVKEWYAQHNQ